MKDAWKDWRMITVFYEDGSENNIRINGTMRNIEEYFLGIRVNISESSRVNMQKCILILFWADDLSKPEAISRIKGYTTEVLLTRVCIEIKEGRRGHNTGQYK